MTSAKTMIDAKIKRTFLKTLISFADLANPSVNHLVKRFYLV
jgi:hypothetical protein